ncbi:MAG: hypothetical protein K6F69_01090, partial [Treponema sp.]|nr:hypothetical protein [Treponema sp.]
MKHFLKVFPIFILILCLSSCVDSVQSISYKNGMYNIYYKVTLSKVLFTLADEDPEELFNNFDEEVFKELPENTVIKPVNTELEIGAEIQFSINPKTKDKAEKSYLPTTKGNKFYIPFLLGESEATLEENESIADSFDFDTDDYSEVFVKAIMSSAKCRILISKNIISSIENAYLEGKGNQNYSIPVFDYGEQYCMEIPFITLYETG